MADHLAPRERHPGRSGPLRLLRGARDVLGPDRGRLTSLGALSVVGGFFEIATLYLVARVALAAAAGESSIAIGGGVLSTTTVTTATGVLLAAGVLLVSLLLAFPIASGSARASEVALVRARTSFVEAYLLARWEHRSREVEGHFQQLATDYGARSERLVQLVSVVIISGMNLLVIAIGSIIVAPGTAIVCLVGLAVIGTGLRPLSRQARRGATRFAEVDRRFASQAAQTARLGQEVAAYDVGPAVSDGLAEEIRDGAASLRRVRFLQRLVPTIFQCAALAVVLALIGGLLALDRSDVAEFGPVLLFMIRGLGYAKQMQNSVQAGNEFLPYAETLMSERNELEKATRRSGGRVPDLGRGVRFEGVDFAYGHAGPVLHQVDLEIGPATSVAVIGPSGAGKSTLVQLLLGLRTPTKGRIVVGDDDLTTIDRHSWAQRTAFVPQDNKLIAGTVADNIRFHRPGFSTAEVIEAARAAHLDEEIRGLTRGYDTVIGPGAQDLSGGQRQRLGIARALLGRPALLVLDEPTSALDARSEDMIRRTLDEMKGAVALVVVAHRPSTIEICDAVVRVERGRVTAELGAAPESPARRSGAP